MSKLIKHTLEFELPEGVDIQRIILNDQGSYEAVCVHWSAPDKWGVPIPTQFGYAFKQHKLEKAIEIAGQAARDNFNRIKGARKPPRTEPLSEEEELKQLLGL